MLAVVQNVGKASPWYNGCQLKLLVLVIFVILTEVPRPKFYKVIDSARSLQHVTYHNAQAINLPPELGIKKRAISFGNYHKPAQTQIPMSVHGATHSAVHVVISKKDYLRLDSKVIWDCFSVCGVQWYLKCDT